MKAALFLFTAIAMEPLRQNLMRKSLVIRARNERVGVRKFYVNKGVGSTQ